MQQRTGPVYIDLGERRDDMTVYEVPEDCVGFVMGRQGATLRSLEEVCSRAIFIHTPAPSELVAAVTNGTAAGVMKRCASLPPLQEWGTLMFFARTEEHGSKSDEKLCIFGDLRARRGAELKVMSAVEHKHPGYCVNSKGELREISRFKGDEDEDGWDTESMLLSEDNFSCVAPRFLLLVPRLLSPGRAGERRDATPSPSRPPPNNNTRASRRSRARRFVSRTPRSARYALGAQGSTRRKLATASGCILEYVGRVAVMVGYKKERRRAREYLGWLIDQVAFRCYIRLRWCDGS